MAHSDLASPTYWHADGLVELALSQFRAARAGGRPDRQRAAFYRLASFHGRTLRVLHAALHARDEPLAQAALANLLTLHRAMLQLHHADPAGLPLPIALSAHSRGQFVRDLVMRVLAETPPALDLPTIHERAGALDLLGRIAPDDVREHLRALADAGYIVEEAGRFVRAPRVYAELDKDVAGLRALLGRTLYQRFAARGFDSLGAVHERAALLRAEFSDLTGLAGPLTCEQFLEAVALLLGSSAEASDVWRYRDLLRSTDPRPYQRAALHALRVADFQGAVVDAPTGSGKTLIGQLCIQTWLQTLDRGQAILALVPTSNYQQQWLDELCYSPHGLQLAPEVLFTGTPQEYARHQRRTGDRPAILVLTYSALAQLGSPLGKGGYDAQSVERFLQQANVQHVLLDEVHKLAEDLSSVSADVARLLVRWQRDTSLRSLVAFSGTAKAFRRRLEELGLGLVYSVPIEDLVAAGFVAPFAELGVPAAFSARERRVRELLGDYKAQMQAFIRLIGPARLRDWLGQIPDELRTFIGHEVLGIYRGRSDWPQAIGRQLAEWASGDPGALKLSEVRMVSVVQLANGWGDRALAEQAGADPEALGAIIGALEALRAELRGLIHLPKAQARLRAEGFGEQLRAHELLALPRAGLPQAALADAVKDLLATTIVGLYDGVADWYQRTGEGRVAVVKAVVEAEGELRPLSGTIVFDRGRHLDWRHGLCRPGYAGVAGLFAELLGDPRFVVMAALSNEMYFTYDPADPVTLRVADYVRRALIEGDLAGAIFTLLTAGLALPGPTAEALRAEFFTRLRAFTAGLDELHAERPGAFERTVLRPFRRSVARMGLGLPGERLLARADPRNPDLARLQKTFFDYALLATHFREAHMAVAEKVDGTQHRFHVVTMPGDTRRKQLMYDLTARIVDAAEVPVNFVIVSDWARTGWNVIRPNLLIDATATRDATAWQQLRGRAVRAWPTWTNACYRLLAVLIGHSPLPEYAPTTGDDDGAPPPPAAEFDASGELDEQIAGLLANIASPAQLAAIAAHGAETLSSEERRALAVALMRRHNKVTHIYELVKATGSASQVIYDRASGRWRRRDGIEAKHRRESGVNPLTGERSVGVDHTPLLYADDPRTDLPAVLQAHLASALSGCDEAIIAGWLGE